MPHRPRTLPARSSTLPGAARWQTSRPGHGYGRAPSEVFVRRYGVPLCKPTGPWRWRVLMAAFERWAPGQGCVLAAATTRRAAAFYRALGCQESAVYLRNMLEGQATK